MGLIINGERIAEDVIEQEFTQIKSSYEAMDPHVQCCDRNDEFRGYAEDNIIARVLLAQQARETVEPLSEEEVDVALAKLKEEHGGEEEFYLRFNVGPDQEDAIRQDVELNLRLEKMIDGLCASLPEPTEQQLREFYEENLERYRTQERVSAMHILKAPERGEEREQIYQEMRELRRQLRDGADFRETAAEHSDKARQVREAEQDPEQENEPGDGIDLGYFARGELMEEFEVVAFSLDVGEVSPVFSSPFGFHLMKLTDRQPARALPFEEVSDQVRQHWNEARRNEKVQEYVQQLRAEAKIETVEETEEDEEEAWGAGA